MVTPAAPPGPPPSLTVSSPRSVSLHQQRQQIILVEGNIGAGKSTLVKRLQEGSNFRAFLEPALDNPFLVKYYADPKKYALPMQLWLIKQR